MAKCPKCEKPFTYVNAEEVSVHAGPTRRFIGVAYVCPLCNHAITVVTDPWSIKNDIVNSVVAKLKGP